MGNMSGDYGSHYTLWQSITLNSQDVANNKSNVTVKMYLSFDGSSYNAYTNYATSGSMMIDGITRSYSISNINFTAGKAKDILLAEWTGYVNHKEDGTQTLNVTGSWNTDTTRIGSGSCSTSLKLTDIPRYANLTALSVKNRTVNTITLSYTTDRPAWLFINLNNGEGWLNGGEPFKSNTTSGEITISYKDRASTKKLDPNTTYNITVLCRALNRDSELNTSREISATTYDIAKISSLANFEHGNNPVVGISNPASISSLSLVTKIGDTQILSRTVKAGNNTIIFSDTELDNLYKKYGSSNSLTATFVLSGSGYTNAKTCTITLKGNQKTMRTNVSGSWKRGKLWTNVNGTWKRGVLWTNVNGTWKRGI